MKTKIDPVNFIDNIFLIYILTGNYKIDANFKSIKMTITVRSKFNCLEGDTVISLIFIHSVFTLVQAETLYIWQIIQPKQCILECKYQIIFYLLITSQDIKFEKEGVFLDVFLRSVMAMIIYNCTCMVIGFTTVCNQCPSN